MEIPDLKELWNKANTRLKEEKYDDLKFKYDEKMGMIEELIPLVKKGYESPKLRQYIILFEDICNRKNFCYRWYSRVRHLKIHPYELEEILKKELYELVKICNLEMEIESEKPLKFRIYW